MAARRWSGAGHFPLHDPVTTEFLRNTPCRRTESKRTADMPLQPPLPSAYRETQIALPTLQLEGLCEFKGVQEEMPQPGVEHGRIAGAQRALEVERASEHTERQERGLLYGEVALVWRGEVGELEQEIRRSGGA